MFRLWGKLYKDNKVICDMTVEDHSSSRSRTQKIFAAIEAICQEFDLSQPIWFDSNISTFKRLSKTRFSKDNFIDRVNFDYFEIQVIEED